ncbi:hypothetical protein EVAR_46057_1 [Eumeta japonica]|uniref:Uncharacterized protein n=1 Tax=Eumeta variegata TaxID=151549 RepID=A0A4C2ACR3_EUMVA|nr:hypothetical protein EVAR_46057_1 [Eumeta japonica]
MKASKQINDGSSTPAAGATEAIQVDDIIWVELFAILIAEEFADIIRCRYKSRPASLVGGLRPAGDQ